MEVAYIRYALKLIRVSRSESMRDKFIPAIKMIKLFTIYLSIKINQ